MTTLLSDPKLVKMLFVIFLGIILVETIAIIVLAIKKNQILYVEKEVPVNHAPMAKNQRLTPLEVSRTVEDSPTVLTPLEPAPPVSENSDLDLMSFKSSPQEIPEEETVVSRTPSQIITGLVLGVTVNGFTQEVKVPSFPCLLGREGDKCDIVISEPAVSRRHAKFIKEHEEVYIEDVSEHNGTFLNEVKLPPLGKAKVHEGDEITLGRVRIKVKSYLYS